MNTIYKYSLLLLTLSISLLSCRDSSEVADNLLTGSQVYFTNELPSVVEVDLTQSSFTIPVERANSEGAVTIPVTATMPDGSVFNVPSSVTFADGQTTANLVVTYDNTKLTYGDYTPITITLADEANTTPYGMNAYTFSAGATEWVSMGDATFREDAVASLFGLDPITYQVPIEKSIVTPGMYRLVNPYGALYPYNEPGDFDTSRDYYLVIDATDPDFVYFEQCPMGFDWSYGSVQLISYVQYLLDKDYSLDAVKASAPELFGTLENGVIAFKEPGSILLYMGDGLYQGNGRGLFAIALPGYVIADYSVEYTYEGRFTDASGQNYIQGVVNCGEDVSTVKVALVTAETADAVYDQIIAGEAGVEVVSGLSFLLPFNASGTYYVLVVPFDAEGEPQEATTSKVTVQLPGETTSVNWVAAYIGDYYYDLLSDPDNEKYEIATSLVLSTDADNDAHYQIAPWGNDATLEFYLNEDMSITVPKDQPTGISGNAGELYVTDLQTYTNNDSRYAAYVSNYSSSIFTLYLVYYNDSEAHMSADTFTLTGNAEVKSAVRISSKTVANINTGRKARRIVHHTARMK